MKRVLFSQEETIHTSDLVNKSHVGFVSGDGTKGYVIHDNGLFSAIANVESMGNCNWSYNVRHKVIKELIKLMAIVPDNRKRITEVFVFETRSLLYKWLSE